ncbi:MAG: hypothetical protein JXA10_12240 [Anaerolineae bacterium]|nr:hypothetical protein [Anaerolineae bacterium]
MSDPDATLLDQIGSPGIPTSGLLAGDGTVLAIHVGTLTHAHAALFELIAQHPGLGYFDAADYADVCPAAEIAPIDPAHAIPISAEESAKGTITDANVQQVYTFNDSAGQTVTIQMSAVFRIATSGQPDSYVEPYLVLLAEDATGFTRIAESSDYFYDQYARLESITLPEDGTYYIVATRFLEADGLSAGPYEVFLLVE